MVYLRSSRQAVYLKLTIFYTNYTSIKKRKKRWPAAQPPPPTTLHYGSCPWAIAILLIFTEVIFCSSLPFFQGFPGGVVVKNPSANAGDAGDVGSIPPWLRKSLWRWEWKSTPVLLPGKPHGQRSLAGYSPWGCKELDTTEHAHIIFLFTHGFLNNAVDLMLLNFICL